MKLLVAALAVLTAVGPLWAAVPGPVDEWTFKSERHGLSIEGPEGWKLISGEGPEAERLSPRTICNFTHGNVAVISLWWTVIKKQGKLEDCADLQREGFESLKRGDPAWEFLDEPGLATLRGRQILRSVAANGGMALVQCVFLRERVAYRLTLMCPRANLEPFRKIFDKTAGSLSFHGRAQKPADLATEVELGLLGAESYQRKDFELATELFEAALSKNPPPDLEAEIHFGLSCVYLEQGIVAYSRDRDDSLFKKSIECAEKSLELKPGFWLAAGNIATAYMNQNELEKAEEYYLLAEKNADRSHPSYRQLSIQHGAAAAMLKARKEKGK